jgi:hypothetical protein
VGYETRTCFGHWDQTETECVICDTADECRAEVVRQNRASRVWQYTQNSHGHRVMPSPNTPPVRVAAPARLAYRNQALRPGESPWWGMLWDTFYAMISAGLGELSTFFQNAPRPLPPKPRALELPAHSVERLPELKDE